MKGVAEIAIVGLIGTFTIVAGIIIPPSIIKTTVGRELVIAYNFEKAQHELLSLVSSTQDGRPVYELIGLKIILKDTVDINKAQNIFTKAIKTSYCIVVNPQIKGVQGTQEEILKSGVCEIEGVFNTVIVLPYNKEALVKVIGIGVK